MLVIYTRSVVKHGFVSYLKIFSNVYYSVKNQKLKTTACIAHIFRIHINNLHIKVLQNSGRGGRGQGERLLCQVLIFERAPHFSRAGASAAYGPRWEL